MQWYYAVGDQRHGPVEQAEFEKLVSDGTIKGDMLVWHQGMTGWQPYSAATGTGLGAPTADDGTEVCAVSGQRRPRREMINYEGKWISAEHRDAYFQRLREGVAQPGESGVPGPFGYGGFWRRFGARVIDGLIQGVVVMPISMAIGFSYGTTSRLQPGGLAAFTQTQLLVQGISLVIALAYEIFFVRKFDATPGKMALGLKIFRPDGAKLSIGRIIGRHFATIVSTITLLIGYIMAAFDDEKRALHDRIADTRVIQTK